MRQVNFFWKYTAHLHRLFPKGISEPPRTAALRAKQKTGFFLLCRP